MGDYLELAVQAAREDVREEMASEIAELQKVVDRLADPKSFKPEKISLFNWDEYKEAAARIDYAKKNRSKRCVKC